MTRVLCVCLLFISCAGVTAQQKPATSAGPSLLSGTTTVSITLTAEQVAAFHGHFDAPATAAAPAVEADLQAKVQFWIDERLVPYVEKLHERERRSLQEQIDAASPDVKDQIKALLKGKKP